MSGKDPRRYIHRLLFNADRYSEDLILPYVRSHPDREISERTPPSVLVSTFPDLNSVRIVGSSNDVNGSHGHAFKGTRNLLLMYLIAAHCVAQFPHLPLCLVP